MAEGPCETLLYCTFYEVNSRVRKWHANCRQMSTMGLEKTINVGQVSVKRYNDTLWTACRMAVGIALGAKA